MIDLQNEKSFVKIVNGAPYYINGKPLLMNFQERVFALAEGYPGSISALNRIAIAASEIDPGYPRGFDPVYVFFLDTINMFGLYGAKAENLLEKICYGDEYVATAIISACRRDVFLLREVHMALQNVEAGKYHDLDTDAIVLRAQNIPGYGLITAGVAAGHTLQIAPKTSGLQ